LTKDKLRLEICKLAAYYGGGLTEFYKMPVDELYEVIICTNKIEKLKNVK